MGKLVTFFPAKNRLKNLTMCESHGSCQGYTGCLSAFCTHIVELQWIFKKEEIKLNYLNLRIGLQNTSVLIIIIHLKI